MGGTGGADGIPHVCPACGSPLRWYTLAKRTRKLMRPRTEARLCDGMTTHIWIVTPDDRLITEAEWLREPKRRRNLFIARADEEVGGCAALVGWRRRQTLTVTPFDGPLTLPAWS